MRMVSYRARFVAALCGAALIASGCGGGDDDSGQDRAATPTATAPSGGRPGRREAGWPLWRSL
jgi:hypothetical protein